MKTSKRYRKYLLSTCLLCIYLINFFTLFSFLGSKITNWGLIPLCWVLSIWIVGIKFPKICKLGKLRNRETIYTWAFCSGVLYILVHLGCGFLLGFGRGPYNYTLKGILLNIYCVGIALIGKEYIRGYWLECYGKRIAFKYIALIIFTLTLIDINPTRIATITSLETLIIFLMDIVAPLLSKNLLATYLNLWGGPLAAIIFMGIASAFEWLCPILPDMNWLVKSCLSFGIPLVLLMLLIPKYAVLNREVTVHREDDENIWSYLVTSVFCISLIWFVVGVFPVYPSAIATGSMKPNIQIGDVVLVQKIETKEDIDALEVGDIIQFQYHDILINHRIHQIIKEDNLTYFQTKGDNNITVDDQLVDERNVKGKIIKVIPKIGKITLFFKKGK